MRHARLYCYWNCLLLLLAGCAALGLPTPATFNEKALAAYGTVQEIVKDGDTLLAAKKLSPDDAQNVLTQALNARNGIDIARSIYKSDSLAGTTKLTATITVLTALQSYLATKKGTQ